MSHEQRRSLAFLVFLAVFTLSIALNVYQGWTIKQFRVEQTPPRALPLPAGVPVPPLHVTDVGGIAQTVTYQDGRPTVLYVLSPKCGWCARNERNISALVEAKSADYRFIGLSVTGAGLEGYLSARKLSFPIYTDVPRNVVAALGLGSTPQLLVVSAQGKLVKQWKGAFQNATQAEIEAFFGVRLPGLTSATSKAPSS